MNAAIVIVVLVALLCTLTWVLRSRRARRCRAPYPPTGSSGSFIAGIDRQPSFRPGNSPERSSKTVPIPPHTLPLA